MNKHFLGAILVFSACGLIPTGCQQPQQNQQNQTPPPSNQGNTTYYVERDWNGPGWYWGVYFYDRDDYRYWRRHYRGRYYPRYYYRGRPYQRHYRRSYRGRGGPRSGAPRGGRRGGGRRGGGGRGRR